MAREVEALIRFEGEAPTEEEVEETLDCIVLQWIPGEELQ